MNKSWKSKNDILQKINVLKLLSHLEIYHFYVFSIRVNADELN